MRAPGTLRGSPPVEREQNVGRLQLEGIPLARELLGRALAGRVLQLPQLPQESIALAREVAHLEVNRTGPRRTARNGDQAQDGQRAGDEPHREDGEGWDPVDALAGVHDGNGRGLGGTPPGQS